MNFVRTACFLVLLSFFACGSANEAEEARNMENRQKKERTTEEKDLRTAGSDISVETLDQKVRSYVRSNAQGDSGRFHIKKDGKILKLRLVRVHTENISTLAPQRHFACVDMVHTDGNLYDVDFFLEGTEGGLKITQQSVHKRNGVPFYSWEQKPDGTWHRVSVERASKEAKGVKEKRDSFRFYYEATLPEIEGKAELWMPVPSSDRFQDIEVLEINTPVKHRMIRSKEFGNKVLYMELGPEQSGAKIKASYQVRRKEKGSYKDSSATSSEYLSSNPLIPVNDRFKQIAQRVLEGKKDESQLVRARALYEHVLDTIAYKKVGKYGTGDASYACRAGKGNCSEFHSYFIALARSAGIPARFSIGAGIPAEREEGGVNGYHCWAEFHANGKWWPVDISEAKKYPSLKAYYFGHHPANRIELSDGRHLKLDPKPEQGPIRFLAYPHLEVEGEKKPIETVFTFSRRRVS